MASLKPEPLLLLTLLVNPPTPQWSKPGDKRVQTLLQCLSRKQCKLESKGAPQLIHFAQNFLLVVITLTFRYTDESISVIRKWKGYVIAHHGSFYTVQYTIPSVRILAFPPPKNSCVCVVAVSIAASASQLVVDASRAAALITAAIRRNAASTSMATRSRVRAVESAGPSIFDGGNATVKESHKKALERQARIFDKRGTFVCTFNVRGCCDETKIRSVAVCFSQSPIQLVALQDTRRTSDFAKVELEGWSIFESPMEKSAHAGGILVLWRAPLPSCSIVCSLRDFGTRSINFSCRSRQGFVLGDPQSIKLSLSKCS